MSLKDSLYNIMPKKELLVPNSLLDGFRRGMISYQSEMNKDYQKLEIVKETEEYSKVILVNFDDNDLMLFGWYFYRTLMNTNSILVS